MVLFNAQIEFVSSGVIVANTDTIHFKDSFITTSLPVAEAGHPALDSRFVNSSILGALNELLNGLIDTSGTSLVRCYTEGVDAALATHTLNHNLNTLNVDITMYDASPLSGPVAKNVIMEFTPIDANNARVTLDTATSGYFIVWGCL